MSTTTPQRHPAHRWAWALVIGALLLLALGAGVSQALDALQDVPLQISIDGEPWRAGFDLASAPPSHKLAAGVAVGLGVALALAAALLAVVAAAAIVPVALLASLAAVVFALALGVGLPLLLVVVLVTALGAVLLSPLIAVGALVWWAVRRPRAGSTTIAA
jgi:hypothetical protein